MSRSSCSAGEAVGMSWLKVAAQDFFDPLHQNDGELVGPFHRQMIGLGCCLFDPDFCPMPGCGWDSVIFG